MSREVRRGKNMAANSYLSGICALPKSLLRAMTVSQCGQWNLATFSVCFCRMCIFMVPLWVNRAWQM